MLSTIFSGGDDLIVILDDATSEIYYAQLVEEESTAQKRVGAHPSRPCPLRHPWRHLSCPPRKWSRAR